MKRSVFAAAFLAGAAFGDTAAWPKNMWLGRGGQWARRAAVRVANGGTEAWEGKTVALKAGSGEGELPVAGVRIEELRLADAGGKLYEFGVWDAEGKERLEKGPAPEGAIFTIPATCAAGGAAEYWVYWGNAKAWGLADFWKEPPAKAVKGAAKAGAAEKTRIAEKGADEPWRAGWDYRVPFTLVNSSAEAAKGVLGVAPLAEITRGTRNAEYATFEGGEERAVTRFGDRAIFPADLPAETALTRWVYVREGARKPAAAAKAEGAAESGLGSDIPSDQVLRETLTESDAEAMLKLVRGGANLLANPDFSDGMKGWSAPKSGGGVEAGKSADGVRLKIAPEAEGKWVGWRQRVEVKPGKSYLYGALVKTAGTTKPVSVNAHVRRADGKVAPGGYATTPAAVSGGEWTPLYGTLTAGEGAKWVELHLTTHGSGEVRFSAPLLAECETAAPGEPENAPPREGARKLVAMQVPGVVKIFPETPVKDNAEGKFAISLAKNEVEPLQLAVRSAEAIADLELALEPSAEWKAQGIEAKIGRVAYVPLDWPTAYYGRKTPAWELRHPETSGQCDGWSGTWPDPIEPRAKGPVGANATHAYRVEVKAPAGAKAGKYSARLLWKSGGKTLREDTATVEVWNFALPEETEFPAVFDVRGGGAAWRAALGGTEDEREEKFWALMASMRLCPDRIGKRIRFGRDAKGNVTADFTEYDRMAEKYFGVHKFPFSYTPGCFYCFGWGLPPAKFMGEEPYEGKWPYEGADRSRLRPAYRRAYQQALKLYWDHVKAKGWADKICLYISDEPFYGKKHIVEQMKALCAMIREVDPGIRIYSSTWGHCEEWNGSITAWGAGHYGRFPLAKLRERAAAGDAIIWTTDGQMCLDTPYSAVERLLPHYAHKYGAKGYEFWGCTWLTYNPWERGWHSYIRQSDTPGETYWIRYPAGDGYLIYPPREGDGKEPVPTVRMASARDGVEDWMMLKMLEARAERDAAAAALLAEFRELVTIPNPGGRYSGRILPEPERLEELRMRAGKMLSR